MEYKLTYKLNESKTWPTRFNRTNKIKTQADQT